MWGSATSSVALVTVNTAFPDSFDPGTGQYEAVRSFAEQAADGKIIMGGDFNSLPSSRRYTACVTAGRLSIRHVGLAVAVKSLAQPARLMRPVKAASKPVSLIARGTEVF